MLLKTGRLLISIVVIAFSTFILLTKQFEFLPYMLLALGASTMMIGISELQHDRKNYWAYASIIASLFVFYVSIQSFLVYGN